MEDLRNLLKYIDPASCSYEEWTQVGMALKEEGFSASVWDEWSRQDYKRYHDRECIRKWNTFRGNSMPVTGGTIYQMAVDRGYRPEQGGYELDWDSPIDQDGVVVDQNWLEGRVVHEPKAWHPAQQLITYLETLFEPGEVVGFVTKSWKTDSGKYVPKDKGVYNKTAGELIEELSRNGDEIDNVVGTYDPEGGAWIRFNPLDGKGVRNENVAELRYALVESDSMDIEKQNATLRELELPIAALVFSGGKSLHAIVRIDADSYPEYKKRVDYLYTICEKNGMAIDTQNRNPSRLSRMPGCIRGDKKQYIVETNIGKSSWEEWYDWIESVNDNLPDIESLEEQWGNIPELAPPLIEGVLRQGHKMLISGPSKAGKSFALIELCIAIAEGRKWLQWQCARGRVLYINLELDRASCLHRFRDVYQTMGIQPTGLRNITIWNLRGKSIPMDKLAPKLIRRAEKQQYTAIIIDPIYKIITGDENSADQMAKFCNQFDLVCASLGCAVIYCHHHSKGSQGQKKAIDRASGSGVFARDPDAVLDLIELETTPELMEQQENKSVCRACAAYLDAHMLWDRIDVDEDTKLNSRRFLDYCENALSGDDVAKWHWQPLSRQAEEARGRARAMTAWRIEGTLREFARFDPINIWFRYPAHYLDESDSLKDIDPETEKPSWEKMKEARTKKIEQEKADNLSALTVAFEGLENDGVASAIDIAEEIGVSADTVKRWFGNGKRSRKEYKKLFEVFENQDDKRLYLRRKEEEKPVGTIE